MSLQNKVALITGAASGIGRECALKLASQGATVVIADLNQAAADKVAEEIKQSGGKAMGVVMDVTDEAAVNAGTDLAAQTFGGIDILVANAGIQIVHPIEDFPFADWKKLSPFTSMVRFSPPKQPSNTCMRAAKITDCP